LFVRKECNSRQDVAKDRGKHINFAAEMKKPDPIFDGILGVEINRPSLLQIQQAFAAAKSGRTGDEVSFVGTSTAP
jgi:hypothetical protein